MIVLMMGIETDGDDSNTSILGGGKADLSRTCISSR